MQQQVTPGRERGVGCPTAILSSRLTRAGRTPAAAALWLLSRRNPFPPTPCPTRNIAQWWHGCAAVFPVSLFLAPLLGSDETAYAVSLSGQPQRAPTLSRCATGYWHCRCTSGPRASRASKQRSSAPRTLFAACQLPHVSKTRAAG